MKLKIKILSAFLIMTNFVFAQNIKMSNNYGSELTLSHRRFTDDAPVVSVEIPGSIRNFNFVVQLCAWLTDLGSTTDQILYNHPNQHSASDPDYKGWKKGFKIRFLVRSFLTQGTFLVV